VIYVTQYFGSEVQLLSALLKTDSTPHLGGSLE